MPPLDRPLAPLALLEGLSGGDRATLILGGVLLVIIAFTIGRMWARILGARAHRARSEKMFELEKSLADFYEHEKGKFSAEREGLGRQVAEQARQIDELRRRAAGAAGRGKDARAELMLELLAENQALQEKLFEANARQKEERDRTLRAELERLGVQRVLLSRLLAETGVRDAVVEVLADDRRVAELRAGTAALAGSAELPAPVADPAAGSGPGAAGRTASP